MKKKISFDQPEKTLKVEVPDNSSGFLNGLVLGALAGAAGFFLYGTKKGRIFSAQVVKKMDKIKKDLQELKRPLCCQEKTPSKIKDSKTKKTSSSPAKK